MARRGLSAAARAVLEVPPAPEPLNNQTAEAPPHLNATAADAKHIELGGFYCQAAVDYRINLLRRYVVHASGDMLGEPFEPSPWQVERILEPLYGWHNADGSRRYRRSYIEGGKKVTGKSTFAAALSVTHLLEKGAEIYQVAGTKEQATSVTFQMTVNMIELGELSLYIDTRPYKGEIYFEQERARLFAKSCKPFSGPSPTFLVFDELHEWGVNALAVYDAWIHSGLARKNSLIFSITNAGKDLDCLAYRINREATAILENESTDTELYPYLCKPASLADAKKEILSAVEGSDELPVLRSMSPHLDEVTSERAIAAQIRSACKDPDGENNALRFFYCFWVAGADRDWLGPLFKKTELPYTEDSLLGRSCFAGFDRAVSRDMTSLVLCFPREREDEPEKLLPYFWLPEKRVDVLRKFVPGFKSWVDEGYIRIFPGSVFDYELFYADLEEITRRFKLVQFLYDPHKADVIGAAVENNLGIERVTFSQSNRNYHQYTTEFEDRLNAGEIAHNGNPVLLWQAHNAVRHTDLAGYVRPTKKDSNDFRTVDGIQCSIMAFAGHLQTDQMGINYYDDNDIELI